MAPDPSVSNEDQSTLYVMNLADKKLYGIGVKGTVRALTAGAITSQALPAVSDCVASDMRPFAVTVHHGQVYVGAVCSAESTVGAPPSHGNPSKLHAYVFRFTPGTGFNPTPVFQSALTYSRGCVYNPDASSCLNSPGAWNPWNPNISSANTMSNPTNLSLPQPILSSLAFDNGDLILGLRDRFGDQGGPGSRDPRGGNAQYNMYNAGDTLRACLVSTGVFTSGWALETNASCIDKQPFGTSKQTAGKDNGQGPGNGEYYYQDNYSTLYNDVGWGGILQIPGFSGVMTTAANPTDREYAGGVHTYDNHTGEKRNGYEVYVGQPWPTINALRRTLRSGRARPAITLRSNIRSGWAYADVNGLGSLAAFCQAAPIEIGNRVWNDLNGNGIQDANEPPLAGVTVNLYRANGTSLVTSQVTDTNGEYAFPIGAHTNYIIKLDHAADYVGNGPLVDLHLTTAHQDTAASTIDSKAVLPVPARLIGRSNYHRLWSPLIQRGRTIISRILASLCDPICRSQTGIRAARTSLRDKVSPTLSWCEAPLATVLLAWDPPSL